MNSKIVIYLTLFVSIFAMSKKIIAQPIPNIINETELINAYSSPKQRAKPRSR